MCPIFHFHKHKEMKSSVKPLMEPLHRAGALPSSQFTVAAHNLHLEAQLGWAWTNSAGKSAPTLHWMLPPLVQMDTQHRRVHLKGCAQSSSRQGRKPTVAQAVGKTLGCVRLIEPRHLTSEALMPAPAVHEHPPPEGGKTDTDTNSHRREPHLRMPMWSLVGTQVTRHRACHFCLHEDIRQLHWWIGLITCWWSLSIAQEHCQAVSSLSQPATSTWRPSSVGLEPNSAGESAPTLHWMLPPLVQMDTQHRRVHLEGCAQSRSRQGRKPIVAQAVGKTLGCVRLIEPRHSCPHQQCMNRNKFTYLSWTLWTWRCCVATK